MPDYQYKASDSSGKIVKGDMEAPSEAVVVSTLRDKHLIPIRIAQAGPKRLSFDLWNRFGLPSMAKRIGGREIMLFTQDLATLLGAGLPVDRSLDILFNAATKDAFKDIILRLRKDVQSGSYLSNALANHPGVFSRFYVNMVKAGESGGVLEPVLLRMGHFLETAQELLDYIRSALIYPIFLVALSGLSIIVLMTVVIPKFSVIFDDLGAALPLSTQLLLGVSGVVSRYLWLIVAAAVAAAIAFDRYRRTPAGRMTLDRTILRVPLIGRLVREIETARFTRTLGTLLKSGVPILQALVLVKDVVQNQVLSTALDTVHARVKEGEHLSAPLKDSGMFPDLAIQMITVGEETGQLDLMLLKVGESYEKSVRTNIKRVIGLLEPITILVMGLVIGCIVISMLAAIFSINDIPF
jgi:general secretion pathway protein F